MTRGKRNDRASCAALAALLLLAGCSREARTLEPEQPQTPPNGPADPRIPYFTGDVYQIAQGGRYFTWYGCGGCHGAGSQGARNLDDPIWKHGGSFDRVYAFIAHGHPGALAHYGERVPTEQMWQITAYVENLPKTKPEERRRQDLDEAAEPTGDTWTGPVR